MACNCFKLAPARESRLKPPSRSQAAWPPPISMGRPSKTVVLIAHGAFQTAYHYQSFLSAIRNHTTIDRATCPLQTTSVAAPRTATFFNDIQILRETIIALLQSNSDILLVCHCYGGIPGCEALTALPESIEGHVGKVLGVVFVSAVVPGAGTSFMSLKPSGTPAWVKVQPDLSQVTDPINILFNGIQNPFFAQDLASRIVPQATQSLLAEARSKNWTDYRCFYIRCLHDKALSIGEQSYYAKLLQDASDEPKILRDIDADHSPFASAPIRLAKIIEEIADELRSGTGSPAGKEDSRISKDTICVRVTEIFESVDEESAPELPPPPLPPRVPRVTSQLPPPPPPRAQTRPGPGFF